MTDRALGEGLRTLTLRVREEDVVLVRGILLGYDGIASVHGEESDVIVFVATESTFGELEAIVADLPGGLVLERLG